MKINKIKSGKYYNGLVDIFDLLLKRNTEDLPMLLDGKVDHTKIDGYNGFIKKLEICNIDQNSFNTIVSTDEKNKFIEIFGREKTIQLSLEKESFKFITKGREHVYLKIDTYKDLKSLSMFISHLGIKCEIYTFLRKNKHG